jgi:hypothetical protein
VKAVPKGTAVTLPRAVKIELRRGVMGIVPSGFDVVFDRPPALEVVQDVVAAFYSDGNLPQITVADSRLTVVGEDEVYVKLRRMFEPEVPHTAFISKRLGSNGNHRWTTVFLCGEHPKAQIEELAARLRERVQGGDVRAKEGSHQSSMDVGYDRIIATDVSHPDYDARQAWIDLLLEIGIAAT